MLARHSPRHSAASLAAVATLTALLLALPGWLFDRAEATPSCVQPRPGTSGDYGQVRGAESGANADRIGGVRATEYINPYATCGLISSVAMLRSDSVTMEFGYVKGWILCGSSWARYSSPTPFAFWQYMSGKYWCKTFPSLHPPSGGTATFQVSDTNSNAYWGSWYSGKELQPDGINLGVTGGYALVNMERESSTDGGGAHFYNATAYKYGGWTLFGGLQLLRDDDPDYDLIVVSTFEGKVARP